MFNAYFCCFLLKIVVIFLLFILLCVPLHDNLRYEDLFISETEYILRSWRYKIIRKAKYLMRIFVVFC